MRETSPGPMSRVARRLLTAPQRTAIAGRLRQIAQARHRLAPGYAENRRRLAAMRDSRRGETCVIIGNGPSMRGFDLDRLAGIPCFALNRGYLMWQGLARQPDFLVAVNDLVLHQFSDEIAATGLQRFVPWDFHRAFDTVPGTHFIETQWRPRFHRDITTGTWLGATVTFSALQIAYHLGFSRVVLIGVDHSFRFEGMPNGKLIATGDDPNHFDPRYFSGGAEWHAPDLSLSEVAYGMANDAFRADGRVILDATARGQLRVFPRLPLDEALRG